MAMLCALALAEKHLSARGANTSPSPYCRPSFSSSSCCSRSAADSLERASVARVRAGSSSVDRLDSSASGHQQGAGSGAAVTGGVAALAARPSHWRGPVVRAPLAAGPARCVHSQAGAGQEQAAGCHGRPRPTPRESRHVPQHGTTQRSMLGSRSSAQWRTASWLLTQLLNLSSQLSDGSRHVGTSLLPRQHAQKRAQQALRLAKGRSGRPLPTRAAARRSARDGARSRLAATNAASAASGSAIRMLIAKKVALLLRPRLCVLLLCQRGGGICRCQVFAIIGWQRLLPRLLLPRLLLLLPAVAALGARDPLRHALAGQLLLTLCRLPLSLGCSRGGLRLRLCIPLGRSRLSLCVDCLVAALLRVVLLALGRLSGLSGRVGRGLRLQLLLLLLQLLLLRLQLAALLLQARLVGCGTGGAGLLSHGQQMSLPWAPAPSRKPRQEN